MSWQRLRVRVEARAVPVVETLLEAAGAAAVSLADAQDAPVLEPEPGETPLWPNVVVTALFEAGADLTPLRRTLAAMLGAQQSAAVEPLADAAWQRAGADALAVRRIGPRLTVAPAQAAVPAQDGACVRINMGLAFGTGAHPTTSLCLEWLEQSFEAGARVLDYGCGSGVLALAALALGAPFAWAVDNDPQALIATRDNAGLNGAVERLWIGPPEGLPDVKAEVLLANILARPLIDRAAAFASAVVDGGTIVLSGVLREQQTDVVSAYLRSFEIIAVAERDGWLRIVGRRRDRDLRE